MRIKHVIGIAFTCMVFIFSCQAQSSTESHAGKNKQEQKIKPRHLTKAEFLSKVANYEKTPDKWEYLGSKPCIIDFYATWCGPCRKLAPILEEIAGEYAGKIDVYKIDVDKEPGACRRLRCTEYPYITILSDEESTANRRRIHG